MAQNIGTAHGVKILTASKPDQLERLILDFMDQSEHSGYGSARSVQYQAATVVQNGNFYPLFTAMIVY